MNIKLGEIFSLQMGKTPSRSEKKYWSNGKYDWVSIADLSRYETYVESTKEKISQKAVDESGIKLVPPNTVIMSFKLSIGKTAITRENTYTNEAIMAFIPRKSELVCPSYFFHLFRGLNWDKVSNRAVMGSTLNKSSLSQISISLPLVEEQKRIARLFDSINTIIVNCKKQLTKLDELVKSRFIELFGDLSINPMKWPVMTFREFAKIDTQMIHNFSGYYEYPHIGIECIEKDTGVLSSYRTIKDDHVVSGKYWFTGKHIIYSKIRPNLNKVALPSFDGLCSADAYPILPKETVCSRYFLAYVMRSKFFLDYILAYSNRTNLPKVNKKQVEGFECPIPPLNLQKTFELIIRQVDKSKLAIQKSLDELEILKKSLMQKYFG